MATSLRIMNVLSARAARTPMQFTIVKRSDPTRPEALSIAGVVRNRKTCCENERDRGHRAWITNSMLVPNNKHDGDCVPQIDDCPLLGNLVNAGVINPPASAISRLRSPTPIIKDVEPRSCGNAKGWKNARPMIAHDVIVAPREYLRARAVFRCSSLKWVELNLSELLAITRF